MRKILLLVVALTFASPPAWGYTGNELPIGARFPNPAPVISWLRKVIFEHEVYLGGGIAILFRGGRVTVTHAKPAP